MADRYRLLGLIAQGGMGMIYRGLSLADNKLLAIKISRWSEALQHLRQLEPDAARREEEARVEREFQLLRKASSQTPHIVEAYDAVRDHERVGLYYPMEFLEGVPLAKLPSWGRPLPVDAVVELALQICDGISVAHGLGVVHRDLNPDNIFIVRTPTHPHFVKLIDFGIARDLYARRNIYNTGHDMAFGHLHYLAPEQVGYNPKTGDYEAATAAKLDTRADIFTIGAILFHMLTGFPPFEDDTVEGLALRDWDNPFNLSRAVDGGLLPGALNDIVVSCLAPDPDQRPPDIFVLSDMLRSFKENTDKVPLAPFRQDLPKASSSELWEAVDEAFAPGQEGGLDMFSAEFDTIFFEDDIASVEVHTEPSNTGYMRQQFTPESVGPSFSDAESTRKQTYIPTDVLDALENAPDFLSEGAEDSLFKSHDDLDAFGASPIIDLLEEPAAAKPPKPPPPPKRRGKKSAPKLHTIDDMIEESLLTGVNPPKQERPKPPPPKKPPVMLYVAIVAAVVLVSAGIYMLVSG